MSSASAWARPLGRALNPPEEVMTSGPGTIIINPCYGCTLCKLMLWLGAGSSSFGRLLSQEFPLSVYLCAFGLYVRQTAELLRAESSSSRATIKSCCSVENRCSARFGVLSPASAAGVTLDCHPGRPAFCRLSLCYSESCGAARTASGRFPFMEPPTR